MNDVEIIEKIDAAKTAAISHTDTREAVLHRRIDNRGDAIDKLVETLDDVKGDVAELATLAAVTAEKMETNRKLLWFAIGTGGVSMGGHSDKIIELLKAVI